MSSFILILNIVHCFILALRVLSEWRGFPAAPGHTRSEEEERGQRERKIREK